MSGFAVNLVSGTMTVVTVDRRLSCSQAATSAGLYRNWPVRAAGDNSDKKEECVSLSFWVSWMYGKSFLAVELNNPALQFIALSTSALPQIKWEITSLIIASGMRSCSALPDLCGVVDAADAAVKGAANVNGTVELMSVPGAIAMGSLTASERRTHS